MKVETWLPESREGVSEKSRVEIQSHKSGITLTRKVPNHGQAFVSPPLKDVVSSLKDVASKLKTHGGIRIATGHQPEFFHPGIAYKIFLGARLKKDSSDRRYTFWIVDHEGLGTLALQLPRGQEREFTWEKATLIKSHDIPARIPAENLPDLPSGSGMPRCFERAYARYAGLWSRKGDYRTVAEAVVGTQLDFLTERFLPPDELRSVYSLGQDPDFLVFSHRMLSDADAYRKAFSTALEAVRKRHKIRHPALPLPSMGPGETGLWALDKKTGTRKHLHAVSLRGVIRLSDGGGVEIPLGSDPAELEGLPWWILPRAATLTQFIRFGSCDLFVHGLGGAAYEEVNDILMRTYFQKRGAPYIVSSFTWFHGGDPKASSQDLQNQLRRAKTNPEELVGPDDRFWNLAEAKREALGDLKENRNRQAHAKIQEANSALLRALADRIGGLEEGVRRAQSRLELATREYPVIFMDEEAYNIWERS